jgi:hypothetical protein
MAAGSRLYFTQNLLQRDENAQKKIFDTINPPKNINFWKISVNFWGIVKAGHKITRCNCCCPKSSSAASPDASFTHSCEFPLPAALPRQPLIRSLSVLHAPSPSGNPTRQENINWMASNQQTTGIATVTGTTDSAIIAGTTNTTIAAGTTATAISTGTKGCQ